MNCGVRKPVQGRVTVVVRMQVRLTAEQADALKRLAVLNGLDASSKSMQEVVNALKAPFALLS